MHKKIQVLRAIKNPIAIRDLRSGLTLGEWASLPTVKAIAQLTPFLGIPLTYIAEKYDTFQEKALVEALSLVNEKVMLIEKEMLDTNFLNSDEFVLLVARIMRAVGNDSRSEKIEALSNIYVNIGLNSQIDFNEKEELVKTVDNLSPLDLAILATIVDHSSNIPKLDHPKQFGWERIRDIYENKGIPRDIFPRKLAVLVSEGLINPSTAQIVEIDKTHFLTNFGLLTHQYSSGLLTKEKKGI